MDLFLSLSSQDINWWTGVVWIIMMFLSAVWTLILTAPIHCRISIDEQVMECHISPNLMKKQTHLHLGWPESEYIFIFGWNILLRSQPRKWKFSVALVQGGIPVFTQLSRESLILNNWSFFHVMRATVHTSACNLIC